MYTNWVILFYLLLQVDEHKTATSHGPARLVFADDLYEVAKVYKDHGRVQTANADVPSILKSDAPFFLDNRGKEVSRVAQTIFRLWKRKGFEGSLNPTHLRYTAATKVWHKVVGPQPFSAHCLLKQYEDGLICPYTVYSIVLLHIKHL